MLFAVERLSERSEDWPTNKKFLEVELNIRAAGLARRRWLKSSYIYLWVIQCNGEKYYHLCPN